MSSAILVVVGTVGLSSCGADPTPAIARTHVTDAAGIQRELIDWALALPGDAELGALYAQLNARHFGGDLPVIPVRWEPRLSRVDNVAKDGTTLHGLFGAVNEKAVILLSPQLRQSANLQPTLAHEMVHAYMFKMGEDTTDHGPAFQSVLRRLAIEGALGNATRSDDRAELGRWIAQERTRLNEETVAFNANPTSERLQRIQADQARLQQEIERYNAMTPFPDGFAGTRSTSR